MIPFGQVACCLGDAYSECHIQVESYFLGNKHMEGHSPVLACRSWLVGHRHWHNARVPALGTRAHALRACHSASPCARSWRRHGNDQCGPVSRRCSNRALAGSIRQQPLKYGAQLEPERARRGLGVALRVDHDDGGRGGLPVGPVPLAVAHWQSRYTSESSSTASHWQCQWQG